MAYKPAQQVAEVEKNWQDQALIMNFMAELRQLAGSTTIVRLMAELPRLATICIQNIQAKASSLKPHH
jgi:hypothetical protein